MKTLLFSALALAPLIAVADELTRNPFNHPAFDVPGPTGGSRTDPAAREPLVVSAILVAGDASLVSVGGTIIGIGEQAAGYVLESVAEEFAVFRRDDETVTISLYEQVDNDED